MEPYNQNNVQYQSGGYAPYQGPPGEPMISPQPQPQPQPQLQPQPQAPSGYPEQPAYQNKAGYGYPEQPSYESQEQPNYKVEGDIDPANIEYMVRRGFIMKTYGILFSQLALSTGFIALTFIPAIKDLLLFNIHTNPLILVFLLVFCIVTIVVFIVFGCCRETARTVPINYILLFSFTLCMSFYLSLLCSLYETETVVSALILTCAATAGLTFYASTTKTDFTYCGGFLFALCFILFISFALFFWCGYYVFYCALGVMLYSLYIIYDTQLILGKFGREYSIDDYCFSSLNLYIDIIYLFIKILSILGNKK